MEIQEHFDAVHFVVSRMQLFGQQLFTYFSVNSPNFLLHVCVSSNSFNCDTDVCVLWIDFLFVLWIFFLAISMYMYVIHSCCSSAKYFVNGTVQWCTHEIHKRHSADWWILEICKGVDVRGSGGPKSPNRILGQSSRGCPGSSTIEDVKFSYLWTVHCVSEKKFTRFIFAITSQL